MPENERTDERKPDKITGTVHSVTYRNEKNGFTVLELEAGGFLYTAVGSLPEIFAGEKLSLTGSWGSHASYGEQFKIDSFEQEMPSGSAAIMRYLASGAVKGIGASTAAKIVELFGDSTLDVIEKQPEKLSSIKGISKKKAIEMGESFRSQFGMREAMVRLGAYGLTPMECINVWKKWGASSLDIAETTPFALCASEIGVSFERADAIALRQGFSSHDDGRIVAAIMHILTHNLNNGHTCIPLDKLLPTAERLIDVDSDTIEKQVEICIQNRELVSDSINGTRFIFLPAMYDTEVYCAGRLTYFLRFPPSPVAGYESQLQLDESTFCLRYNEKQREAISAAMEKGALVLTGGPGTGKTTTLNAIIDILEMSGSIVEIAAPTGRAAKRITEITGHDAKTIHRLLEVQWGEFDIPYFDRNENNPLTCDALIVDELSMTDVVLFENLLRAVRRGCRLILVGDSDQLPSVGAGNVLGDLISSGCLPVVELDEIFRQASESAIVTNAHKIVAGEMPDLSLRDNDFFFMNAEEESAVHTISDLCWRRLPAAYGFNPIKDIQVLCPSRKGMCGTVELNKKLQERFNPKHKQKSEAKIGSVLFREGDKVMQIKNNYNIEWTREDGREGSGIFNGDIGIISKIDRREESMHILFDDRTAVYPLDMEEQIEHAYAVTIHKSQGSEFDAVIIPATPVAPQLCYRNLLYTGVTRAKKLLIIIGKQQIVRKMVQNKKKGRRYTALSEFLKNEAVAESDLQETEQ
ncbi:MAG: ATP-dependent RecD-like DNA helicase [Oscillospiraceae bacterium]|nr:ATP-dependent RecD-like DNA helicase [Oscillospiraceae bacterium]